MATSESEQAWGASDTFHDPSRLILRVVLGLVGLMAVVGAVAWAVGPWVEQAGAWFVGRWGLGGVFVGVLFTDTFFLANEPLLGLAYAGGLAFWPVAGVACVASVVAGVLGWGLGRLVGENPWIQTVIRRQRLNELLARWGVWAVAIAAMSPVPYGAATWAAGAARVSLRVVVLGSLFRIPRVLLYFWLVVAVWGRVAR